MNTADLVSLLLAHPVIQAIQLGVTEKTKALEQSVPIAVDKIVSSYDWSFAIKSADQTTDGTTASYTFNGGAAKDCRDLINIQYGTAAGGFIILDKKRPVDMDEFLSGRTVTGVGWWVPDGRDGNFPKAKIINTPPASKTLRYRYRRNNVTVADFPEGFKFVLQSCMISYFAPNYRSLYERDLRIMIDRYEQSGGEDNPTRIDPVVVMRNNERAGKFGYR